MSNKTVPAVAVQTSNEGLFGQSLTTASGQATFDSKGIAYVHPSIAHSLLNSPSFSPLPGDHTVEVVEEYMQGTVVSEEKPYETGEEVSLSNNRFFGEEITAPDGQPVIFNNKGVAKCGENTALKILESFEASGSSATITYEDGRKVHSKKKEIIVKEEEKPLEKSENQRILEENAKKFLGEPTEDSNKVETPVFDNDNKDIASQLADLINTNPEDSSGDKDKVESDQTGSEDETDQDDNKDSDKKEDEETPQPVNPPTTNKAKKATKAKPKSNNK